MNLLEEPPHITATSSAMDADQTRIAAKFVDELVSLGRSERYWRISPTLKFTSKPSARWFPFRRLAKRVNGRSWQTSRPAILPFNKSVCFLTRPRCSHHTNGCSIVDSTTTPSIFPRLTIGRVTLLNGQTCRGGPPHWSTAPRSERASGHLGNPLARR
jgi:hypothetical protein